MARDFDTLKTMLWENFEQAAEWANSGSYFCDSRTNSNIATGTIGQALVDLYREERERAAEENQLGKGLKG